MEWLEMKIDTSHAGLDPVCAMLEQQGVTGLMIDDETDFQDFLEHNRQYWDYVDEELLAEKRGVSRVTFYLERNENALSTIAAVRMAMSAMKKAHPEYAPLRLTIDNVADADWENNWKQFYKPMEIGDRLLVVPEWEQASDPQRITLRLNPGLTFGTGSHATTRLCLQALDTHIHGGERVLDLGCGSGILSIAALLLGADHAVACDIDEKCMDVAYENAALNGVGRDRYTVRWGDVVTDQALRQELGGPYDVVVANIVADVIKALASTVRPLVKEGGIFLCSGIIDDRAEEVAQELVSMVVQKAVKMAQMMNIPIVGLVENMSYITCPDCGKKLYPFGEGKTQQAADEYGLPLLARMPIDPELAHLVDQGRIEDFQGNWLDAVADKL